MPSNENPLLKNRTNGTFLEIANKRKTRAIAEDRARATSRTRLAGAAWRRRNKTWVNILRSRIHKNPPTCLNNHLIQEMNCIEKRK